MLVNLFHWQWLAVFVTTMMKSGANGLHGALLADEMGLGEVRLSRSVVAFKKLTTLIDRPSRPSLWGAFGCNSSDGDSLSDQIGTNSSSRTSSQERIETRAGKHRYYNTMFEDTTLSLWTIYTFG